MKKSFKLIALTLVIVMVSISLCSCRALDEAKANTAIYTDSDKTAVLFRDAIYKYLDTGEYDFIFYRDADPFTYHVIERDVPVLLRAWYGAVMGMSKDGVVLGCNDASNSKIAEAYYDSVSNQNVEYGWRTKFYVREDKYDEIKETVEQEKLDHYYLEYWEQPDYDQYMSSGMMDYRASDFSYKRVLLDDKSTAAIERAKKSDNTEEIQVHDRTQYVDNINVKRVLPLQKCDKDMILTKTDMTTYLVEWVNKDYRYFVTEGCTPDGKCVLYEIDKEYCDLIEKYFEDHPDACETVESLFPYAW